MMKNTGALLRGLAVFGGLAIAHAGWAQAGGQTPGAAGAAPPNQGGTPAAGQPGTAPSGQSGTGAAGAPAAVPVGLQPTGKIAQVTILGNKNVSADMIRAAVTEKAGDKFDPAAAERDREAITALGYWAAPVQLADLTDTNGGVDLTFSVVENPVIQGIKFNANTLSGDPTIPAATLLAQMGTKPGQVLNSNTLQSDLDTLFNPNTGFARRQGFRFAAGSSINVDPTTGVLTIPVVEDFVQAVIVTGSTKMKTADILNALPLKAGDLYSDAAVQTEMAPGHSLGRARIVGPVGVLPTVPGRVVLTVPVADGR